MAILTSITFWDYTKIHYIIRPFRYSRPQNLISIDISDLSHIDHSLSEFLCRLLLIALFNLFKRANCDASVRIGSLFKEV